MCREHFPPKIVVSGFLVVSMGRAVTWRLERLSIEINRVRTHLLPFRSSGNFVHPTLPVNSAV